MGGQDEDKPPNGNLDWNAEPSPTFGDWVGLLIVGGCFLKRELIQLVGNRLIKLSDEEIDTPHTSPPIN